VALSGSSPSAATNGLFSDLIALARARKVPVFLDTYGPSLDAIWGFWPQAIQVNRREAAAHLRRESASEGDLFGLLDRWARHGVVCGIVTDGAGAAVALVHGLRFRVTPPRVDAVNPIGSGDSLLAGVVDAWLSGLPPEGLLRQGFACAVANALVWDAGAVDPDEVERWREGVVIDPLPRV
jgi:fructose-1-phosphate kinase PfkB-like protein